ncbi:MAG: hypothetical protein U0003_05605 [Vampirovibrionales bacterium]
MKALPFAALKLNRVVANPSTGYQLTIERTAQEYPEVFGTDDILLLGVNHRSPAPDVQVNDQSYAFCQPTAHAVLPEALHEKLEALMNDVLNHLPENEAKQQPVEHAEGINWYQAVDWVLWRLRWYPVE